MTPVAKGKKAKKEKEEAPLSINEQLDEKLESVKASGKSLIDLFQYADEYSDLEVECFSTGFPSLDVGLHPKLLGLPRGRDVEISSKDGNIGKSSLAMQIVAHVQKAYGFRCALAEPEKTNTQSYFNQLGVVTDRNHPTIPALRIMRPQWDTSNEDAIMYSAEQFLNAVGAAAQIMDLIVVDSVDALVQAADLEKDADDNNQVGGISKLLSEYFRPHTNKKATILWLNQVRTKVGAWSPSGAEVLVTPGGKAVPFYSSVRIQGSRVESLKDKEGADPYGFVTEWNIFKNKVAPQDRKVRLPYIHGEGFSMAYDTFNLALKMKIIEKAGSWFQYPAGDIKKDKTIVNAPGFLRVQGSRNFYEEMRANPATFNAIKNLIEGDDVEADEATMPPPSAEAQPAMLV